MVELERAAAQCAGMQARLDFYRMAETWRWLAVQASWQDSFTAHPSPEQVALWESLFGSLDPRFPGRAPVGQA